MLLLQALTITYSCQARVVVVVELVVDGMEAGLFSLKIISSLNDIILFNVPTPKLDGCLRGIEPICNTSKDILLSLISL